jgi:hypothetical protein
VQINHTFCTPHRFINVNNNLNSLKWSILAKEQVNLQQKAFMRFTPGANVIKTFLSVSNGFL